MSGAAARAALAAIGADLLAQNGAREDRRSAALVRMMQGNARPPATLAELAATPDWLRGPREAQRRLAVAASLLSMGPALTGSIDGAWLGGLAEEAGEQLLDWAIDRAADLPVEGSSAPLTAGELAAAGFALLRAELPPGLRPYLDWAPGGIVAAPAPAAVSAALSAPDPSAPDVPAEAEPEPLEEDAAPAVAEAA